MNLIKKILLILSVMILILFILMALFLGFFLFGDYLLYNHSVSTKEEVFEMLENNQEEYELLVQKMEHLFSESNEHIIILDGKQEYKEHQLNSGILKQYPVCSISVMETDDNYQVSFDLAFPPNPNNYWGIYHMQNGLPDTWGEGELEKEGEIYVQRGSDFIYKTEKIKDNWYYYECCTR